MKYFNRHENMTRETMDLIQMCKSELFLIKEVDSFGSISNMLAGLYDGFDYSEDILNDAEMAIIKDKSFLLPYSLEIICKTVAKYPKTKENQAIY